MKRIIYYFKKDIVLTVSWGLAAASAFLVRPDKGYAGYIDWRSLGILWTCTSCENTENVAACERTCCIVFL